MRVLVVGAGGVGSAFVTIASRREAFEHITVADIDLGAGPSAAASTAAATTSGGRVDGHDRRRQLGRQSVAELARPAAADVILNACDPRFNPPIFDGAFAAGCTTSTWRCTCRSRTRSDRSARSACCSATPSSPHPSVEGPRSLALVGMGVEPGFSDVAARYASDHLFSRIDEIGVRDGADLVVDGYDFAPTFSIWTTIEECLNPPIIYERDRGWFTTAPFSEPEMFTVPRGHRPAVVRQRRARGGDPDARAGSTSAG